MAVTIHEILTQVTPPLNRHSETAILDAQVLVAHYLDKPRTWIIAHPEVRLNSTQFDNIIQAADRLSQDEPLPYVIGHWEFYGLDFQLTPDVLIPRPETELLVERSLDWLRLHPHRRKAVDVGTGSGCIGIAVAKNIPDLQLLLSDISAKALGVARTNAQKFGLLERLEFIQSDLLDQVIGPFDLILANLPYIPTQAMMGLPVSKREPHLALDGGTSGTELINRLLDQATRQLISGGLMLLEIESSQGNEVKTLAEAYFSASRVQILPDLSGRDRCLEIQRPNWIVHLCQRAEWSEARKQGSFQSNSLDQNGFVHCSQPEQILEVANRYYPGVPDLVLLWLDPDRLTSEIRWESSDGAFFPHIYGPINLEAITSVTSLQPDLDGIYRTVKLPK